MRWKGREAEKKEHKIYRGEGEVMRGKRDHRQICNTLSVFLKDTLTSVGGHIVGSRLRPNAFASHFSYLPSQESSTVDKCPRQALLNVNTTQSTL